jgi:hypothetical protein
MCVGGERSMQRYRVFKRRLCWPHSNVLQHEAMGVRDGMILANAAGEVLLIDAMSIMVQPMNPADRGCVERARRSR